MAFVRFWLYNMLLVIISGAAVWLTWETFEPFGALLTGGIIMTVGFFLLVIMYVAKHGESTSGLAMKTALIYLGVYGGIMLAGLGLIILVLHSAAVGATKVTYATVSTIDGSHGESNPLNRNPGPPPSLWSTTQGPVPPSAAKPPKAPPTAKDTNQLPWWKPRVSIAPK